MLLDTNIVIYACQPGGGWLSQWTNHPDAAIASVTRVEALGITATEESAIRSFFLKSIAYPLDDEVIERAVALRQQVTRNEADFKHIAGLDLRNPFAAAPSWTTSLTLGNALAAFRQPR